MDVEKTMKSILELAHTASHLGTVAARVEEIAALQARTDKRLDRAVRLGVREARQERKKDAGKWTSDWTKRSLSLHPRNW